jgi:hypothetical protein
MLRILQLIQERTEGEDRDATSPQVKETFQFSLKQAEEGSSKIANALSMSWKKGLVTFWRSQGAPIVPLSPCENCFDLEKMLNHSRVNSMHLEAVLKWAKERGWIER